MVSNFYLKGFANQNGQIVQTHIVDGSQNLISTDSATVARDFYTVTLEDGEQSDAVERFLSHIEGPASEALALVLAGLWPVTNGHRHALASWIGLQMIRGSGVRARQTEIMAQTIRLLVGISGKDALRVIIEEAEGVSLSSEDLDAEWIDLTQSSGPRMTADVRMHSRTIYQFLPIHRDILKAGRWTLVRFERRALLTSDHPVSFYPYLDHQPWESLALANAAGVTVALSKRVALQIGFNRPVGIPEIVLPPSTRFAEDFNRQSMNGARRFLYHCPGDDPLSGVELPAIRISELMPISGDFISEDGIFAGIGEEERAALSINHIPEEARGPSMSLSDLPWPIPGRLGIQRPSHRASGQVPPITN